MATYGLIPGAGSDSFHWHRVAPLLQARGHAVVTPDLPCEDDSAGLDEYADVVVSALSGRSDVILVAQSMGGLTAPLVVERRPVDLLVMVSAMTPTFGETPGEWWSNTGQAAAARELAVEEGRDPDAAFDPRAIFFHDVPAEVTAAAFARGELGQSGTPFEKPWPLRSWPDVPTEFLIGRRDRLFPPGFQRRVVRERLGITPDEMDGGHLLALAHPEELVRRLEGYRVRHAL